MRRIKIVLLTLLVITLGESRAVAQENDNETHNELRALVKGIEIAINTEKYRELKQYFHKNLIVTTVNQNRITSQEGIEKYFKEWFGDGGYLISLKMELTPDNLTEFYADKTMGIVKGSGVEKYKLRDGRNLDLKTRWTATVIKDDDGKWRILTLHLGTNFYDNAIYHEMRKQLTKWGVIGSVLMLLAGIGLGYFLRNRKLKKGRY